MSTSEPEVGQHDDVNLGPVSVLVQPKTDCDPGDCDDGADPDELELERLRDLECVVREFLESRSRGDAEGALAALALMPALLESVE